MGRFDEGADDPQAKRTDREGLYFPLCCHRCGGRVVVMEMERERANVKRSINSSWKILAVIHTMYIVPYEYLMSIGVDI